MGVLRLPAGARRLDDAAGRIGGLGYIHFGGVEQDGVRGLRHRRGLPVRGQRTHTNARTRKGPAKAIAGKKK